MDDQAAQILAGISRLEERTTNIDKKLDGVVAGQAEHERADDARFAKVHARIDPVVARQSWILGVGASIPVVLGVVWAWLKDS